MWCKNFASTSKFNGFSGNVQFKQIAENEGDYFVPTIKNMEIWRYERSSNDTAWQMRSGKKEYRKVKLYWKWCKLRSFPLILLLQLIVATVHSPIQLVMAKLRNGYNGYCELNSVPLLATSRTATPALAALFGRTCRCAVDWRSHFCKKIERYKSLLAVPEMQRHENEQPPIVCICRQLMSENICQQFMTQCYFTPENQYEECACCFNQPIAFCNQLQCRNGEPVFDMHANTTCICHAPTFYPYHICAYQRSLIYDHEQVIISDKHENDKHSDYIGYPVHESPLMHHEESTTMRLYGIHITTTSAVAIVLGLLGMIMLLTAILLLVRSCRAYREHRNRMAKRELAQTVLLEQRAEEEKYLP